MLRWARGLLPLAICTIALLGLSLWRGGGGGRAGRRPASRGVLQVEGSTARTEEEDEENFSSLMEEEEQRFPSLKEWLDGREGLYRDRRGRLEAVCREEGVGNLTSNSSVADLINKYTHMDKDHLVERTSLKQFFMSRPNQVIGCLVNKVASSSIVKTFLKLEGLVVKEMRSPHAYSSRLHPKSWEELSLAKEHYTSFLIVRDPLDRLISCYRDKMVTNTHWSLANFRKQVKLRARKIKEGRQRRETEEANSKLEDKQENSKLEEKQAKSKIQQKGDKGSEEKIEQVAAATNIISRRSRHSEKIAKRLDPKEKKFMEDETGDVTKGKRTRRDVGGGSSREVSLGDNARQFWDSSDSTTLHLSHSSALPTAAQVASPRALHVHPKPEDIPSLEEFLEYVLSTDLLGAGFSSHWAPFWRSCTPCHFSYDIIMKLETGADDLAYLWQRTGLDSQAPIPWENRSSGTSTRQSAELKEFLSSLPRDLILRVHEKFLLDYKMFGYDIDTALKMGGHRPLSATDSPRP